METWPSIFDKKINRELLSAPIRLAISTDNPEHWPAWNMDFEDEQRAPQSVCERSGKDQRDRERPRPRRSPGGTGIPKAPSLCKPFDYPPAMPAIGLSSPT